ncbi:MAG: MgtC/SapB family protein [Nitrospirota bacterium]|nr:MgtC/SapB family protein [Nitrospirota bacterium]
MGEQDLIAGLRMVLALVAGGIIGLERTYHGRPAGFRTHALVCLASALLVQVTVNQWMLVAGAPLETLRVDPTRMAQGIMTGIGFLGAGVIMKEGITIRGLTTAASIWITASIGIVVGMGMYVVAGFGTLLSIGVLSLFRWIEKQTPTLRYARLRVRLKRVDHMLEGDLNQLVAEQSVEGNTPSYQLEDDGRSFSYEMTVRTRDSANFGRLAERLSSMEQVQEFSIQPTGD